MRRLGLHVGLYTLLLAAILALIPLDSSFSSDAGAYGGQVFALRQGRWALSRPLPVVDEDHEGWLNTAISPEGPTPYTANPAYSLLLTGAVAVVHGPVEPGRSAGSIAPGLHLVPALGAVASAVVAWFLASLWSRRAAPLAFWLLALGPVLVNATTLWAHTISTALGGAALLFAIKMAETSRRARPSGRTRAFRHPALFHGFAMAVALSASAVVRTEALFWIVAVAGTTILLHRSRRSALVSAAAGATAGFVWLANRGWGQSLRADRLPIETSVQALNEPTTWLASRAPAGWQLLFTSLSGGPGPLLTLTALAIAVLGAVRLRQAGTGQIPPRNGIILLLAAAVLYGARLVLAPEAPISGTLGAWPLVVLLPLAAGQPAPEPPAEEVRPSLSVLAWPIAVLVAAVLATQYANSGGLQWGGRYLSLAFVPLAAAAAVRGEEVFRRYRVALGALLVIPGLLGAMASYQLHDGHRRATDEAVEKPSEVVITELVALPRVAWPELPTAFYRATEDDVEALLRELALAGVATVNVHGLAGVDVDGMGGYDQTGRTDVLRHLVLGPAQGEGGPDGATPSPGARVADP